MLREAFTDRLKVAMKARDTRTVSTVRLILAALKERDVAVRGEGNTAGLAEPDIARMLQGMIKQRRESIALYRAGKPPRSGAAGKRRDRRHRELSAAANERGRDHRCGAIGHRRDRRRRAFATWARLWPQCASGMPARWISAAPVRSSNGFSADRETRSVMAFPPGFLDELRGSHLAAGASQPAGKARAPRARICRSLPVPQRKDAVLLRRRGQELLPLLWLRRAWRRDRVCHAGRQSRFP